MALTGRATPLARRCRSQSISHVSQNTLVRAEVRRVSNEVSRPPLRLTIRGSITEPVGFDCASPRAACIFLFLQAHITQITKESSSPPPIGGSRLSGALHRSWRAAARAALLAFMGLSFSSVGRTFVVLHIEENQTAWRGLQRTSSDEGVTWPAAPWIPSARTWVRACDLRKADCEVRHSTGQTERQTHARRSSATKLRTFALVIEVGEFIVLEGSLDLVRIHRLEQGLAPIAPGSRAAVISTAGRRQR